jgi:hypothetical protein
MKPVAWIDPYDLERLPHHDCWVNGQEHKNSVPLYTHPVKELTDFEIKGVMALDECWIGEDCSMPNMIAFARAILRKAQEK